MDPDLMAEYAREDPNGLKQKSREQDLWMSVLVTLEVNGEKIVVLEPCNGLRTFFFKEDWNFFLQQNLDNFKPGKTNLGKLKHVRMAIGLANEDHPLKEEFDKHNPGIMEISLGQTIKKKIYIIRGDKGYLGSIKIEAMRYGEGRNLVK